MNPLQEPLEPMTAEQLESEAAFAKKMFEKYSNPTPETLSRVYEAIEQGRPLKVASSTSKK